MSEVKIHIPFSEFEFTYVRSSGPGGQNVNKVNSKAVLRWNLWSSQSISGELKAILVEKLSHKLTVGGDLIIQCDETRDQSQNKERCIVRFFELIKKALHQPKKRKPTKVSFSQRKKNEKSKKLHSEKKRNRRSFE